MSPDRTSLNSPQFRGAFARSWIERRTLSVWRYATFYVRLSPFVPDFLALFRPNWL